MVIDFCDCNFLRTSRPIHEGSKSIPFQPPLFYYRNNWRKVQTVTLITPLYISDASSLLGPNIFLDYLFSDTINVLLGFWTYPSSVIPPKIYGFG